MDTQTRTNGTGFVPLGLSAVQAGSLPASLMTTDAPERYTVEAVFTRRPAHDEVTAILSDASRVYLTDAGYPDVELTVADRRLGVANTNLEELRDGLATVLADLLANISRDVHSVQEAAAARSEIAAEHEHARAIAVTRLVESVTFQTSESGSRDEYGQTPAQQVASDGAQIDEWSAEGGHGRKPSRA